MMRGTPRTFVGTVVLLLREPARENGAAVVAEEVARIPGVGSVELDDLLAAIDDLARRRPVWRIGYEHRFATHAALELQRLGEESEMLRLAEAAPHGEWLRWTAP